MSRDVFDCHEWGSATGIIEAMGAAKHCTMHRAAPHVKELSGLKMSVVADTYCTATLCNQPPFVQTPIKFFS